MVSTSTTSDTKTAIADAAEVLMAEHGVNGISLRAILKEAGANPAALHYHFGSREQLIEQILVRQGFRNNRRRREMVEELLARSIAPDVYDIVDALIDPIVQMLDESGESGRRFLRFVARLHSDRTDIHLKLQQREFADIPAGIVRLLKTACPHLSESILQQRITMTMDTMLQSLANADVMSHEWCDQNSGEGLTEVVNSLKDFLAGGLSAHVRKPN